MARFGESRVPHDIMSDEDKWLKFFTKTQLLGIGIAAGIGFLCFKGLSLLGLTMLGIIVMILLIGVGAVIVMFKMPATRYLQGGGLFLWEIIMINIYRKATKCIYVRNYDDSIEE